jgi:hypothetical protein
MTMNDNAPDVEATIERLRSIQTGTDAALESLGADRQQVEQNAKLLEGPTAALEYIDFFSGFFTHVSKECERMAGELPQGLQRGHIDMLRQLASNSAAEQRRCLQFRDKWINKPLAYESQRPLLNSISLVTREQLVAFRALNDIAGELDKPSPESREENKTLDRRALLTRLFKPPEEA